MVIRLWCEALLPGMKSHALFLGEEKDRGLAHLRGSGKGRSRCAGWEKRCIPTCGPHMQTTE